jgi:succinoglycan biosynthesis protein ExoM
MIANAIHISVCICTFKRPHLLRRALEELERQQTEELFTYSVVVADNDRSQSAREFVANYANTSALAITYCVEPEQNIALARNKALEHSRGDYIAFIDDDEYPAKDWLCNLFKACRIYKVDGVLGPVRPYFEHEPPQWAIKGKFFDRPTYDTGRLMDWTETRTGNVLFEKKILGGIPEAFNPEFGTGSEDIDFFRRMIEKGHVFVWCNEAAVYELVPPSRSSIRYLLHRALIRGSSFPKRPVHRMRNITKSVIAIPFYTLILPFLAVFGRHLFIKYLIKLIDHVSRILAFLGWRTADVREM